MSNQETVVDSVDFEFEVEAGDADKRLDVLVTDFLKGMVVPEEGTIPSTDVVPSRSKVAQWIEQGFVRVTFEPCTKASLIAIPGMHISVSVPPPKLGKLVGDSSVQLNIVYEDSDLLVLDKPAGLVVHPGAGQYEGTLVQGLLAYLGDDLRTVGDALRPGIVHRLDKDTSGLMVVAKNDVAYQGLARQFLPPRSIVRTYLAVTERLPKPPGTRRGDTMQEFGEINFPIGRHPVDRLKMAVVPDGRQAKTKWQLKETLRHGLILEVTLETGRTHQIRVHLAHLGAAVLGDTLYGPGVKSASPTIRRAVTRLGRQALHAASLSFLHPRSAEQITCASPLPKDIAELVVTLHG